MQNKTDYVSGDILTIVFPKGTILSTGTTWKNKTVATNDDTAVTKAQLWSTNAKYNFPTLAVELTIGGDGSDGIQFVGGKNCEITGFTTRGATYSVNTADAARAISLGTKDDVCDSEAHVLFDWTTVIAKTADWTGKSITPTDVETRGNNSSSVSISVKATNSVDIPEGGVITLTLVAGWEFGSKSTCSCSALPNQLPVGTAAALTPLNDKPTSG